MGTPSGHCCNRCTHSEMDSPDMSSGFVFTGTLATNVNGSSDPGASRAAMTHNPTEVSEAAARCRCAAVENGTHT